MIRIVKIGMGGFIAVSICVWSSPPLYACYAIGIAAYLLVEAALPEQNK